MNTTFVDLNLHINTTPTKETLVASVKDDNGNILVENNFQYRVDPYILSRLEDSVGKDIPENSKLIRNFGSGLFNALFSGEILGYYESWFEFSFSISKDIHVSCH